MFKIQIYKFDPLSVFKYHASFWMHTSGKEKMMLVVTAIAPVAADAIASHFLNATRNMILSSRYSRLADYAALGILGYIFHTTVIGFIYRSYKKFEKAENLTKLLVEISEKGKNEENKT
jgi:hypothetical protein